MAAEAERARAERVAANLAAVRRRVAAACAAAGRAEDEVTLVAVTKTYPASDVRILTKLGIMDVGENRDQEAAAKAAECADLPLIWHFVGQLQTNKARSVVRYADVVHSVDRVRLARELGLRARAAGRELRCLVQVNLDPESAAGVLGPRGGADPRDVLAVADAIHAEEGLAVGGVMAVAPRGGDPAEAFDRLAAVAAQVRARYPQATAVSAGMSGDLEAAIERGATHLRIGAALLGDRAANVG
ncbi:YggS family pyridoxal phosphate-dependent enzyme [Marinitenerispora sediminis]|uniref:Pyridoxal phosphate homeostasis protein n=1 Tax=Marinitenerispora sediminis TaxID=1931232 RepID=A0A368T548_9ACTN|nr:YggS family pyridoxal phosphate-dependent enzyme [Marinitenerispora sediminis]RCV54497.1 YggS family pyridoxal phosphate-dependent enzyme [Marinitenerispora sediminis]RCV58735.1 YggS family pyridoxal phosphate-dependent enzyme [Marinitenerispora sediminis]RCV61361.1 YggS family pyridoxal phosphate-dependent enzyme [Marinitenerispora sediminis]